MPHSDTNTSKTSPNPNHSHTHQSDVAGDTVDDVQRHYQRRTLWISFLLITGFMLVEAIGGWYTQSLALMSDAGHMLSDALALGATLLAFKIGERAATNRKSFGFKRFEILVAGINGATLIIIAIMIFIEAVKRFSTAPEVASKEMLLIAFAGFIVNLFVAWLLHRGGDAHSHIGHDHASHSNHTHSEDYHSHDTDNHVDTANLIEPAKNLNMQSAYLHVLGDLLGSVAAMIAALAMMWFGWWWADPMVSIMVAALILVSGYRVVKASTHILMEGTPEDISLAAIRQTLTTEPLVKDAHHLHVWSITSGLNALSCHIVVDSDMPISQASQIIQDLDHKLQDLGVSHVTIQVESIHHAHNLSDAAVCHLDDDNK